jgi:hypothetical protein
MVTILPSARTPWDVIGAHLGQNLSQTLPQGIQEGYKQGVMNQQMNQRRQAIAQKFGPEVANLPEHAQKSVIDSILEMQNLPEKYKAKYEAKSNAELELLKQLGLINVFSPQGNAPQEENPQNQSQSQLSQNVPRQSLGELIPEDRIAAASLVNPALADKMQKHNDNILAQRRHEDVQSREREKLDLQLKKASPEYQRQQQIEAAQAQADVKYNQQLQESAKQHELKEQSLDRLEKLNKKGVTGKSFEKLLEKVGLVALTSDGRREFAADVKNLITDIRSILGAQFTGFEFQTILNAYPSADFSQGANEAIIRNLKGFQDIKSKEVEFANQIKKENGGKIPMDFQSRVNERVHDYAASKLPQIKENTRKIMKEEYGIPEGNVLMFDPQGEPLNVSPDQVERYQSLGASLP